MNKPIKGYFCPRTNTFYCVENTIVKEDRIQSYDLIRDVAEGSDIENHAIWDMFSKILHEHSGENV
jgi:hypothetical protein